MKGGKHSNGKFVTSVYRYDPVAREMTCDFGGATNVYRYDADGGGNALLAQAYGRSLTGRLETKTTDAGTWKYGYDLIDQVTNAVLSASASADGAWGYSCDSMGNRKTFSELSASSGTSALSVYSANRLNQYTVITNFAGFAPWRETSLAYDLNGNMTWDGTNAYFWDVQNLARTLNVERRTTKWKKNERLQATAFQIVSLPFERNEYKIVLLIEC